LQGLQARTPSIGEEDMMRDWLIVGFVFICLLMFWLWLGQVFDAISDWHAAVRREDAQADGERGAS